ncbi:MAG: DUF433 domain-containing protein [Parvibaculaceae bacterium]
MEAILTPNEVAALAEMPRTTIEKALEQKVLGRGRNSNRRRLLPLSAVAVAATVRTLGRRLTVSDKRLVARRRVMRSPEELKEAMVEVAPSMVVHVGKLAREAVERAERYTAARDRFIECVPGVQGGRPVIRGTRLTVSAIHGRLSSGDTIADLVEDYPEIPKEAFDVAYIYGETHPQVGRPRLRPSGSVA